MSASAAVRCRQGPEGRTDLEVTEPIEVNQADGAITVTRPNDERDIRARHGLSRSLVANMVMGVTDGYSKTMEIVGVGYRVGQGQGPGVRARLQPPGTGRPAGRDHLRGRDPDQVRGLGHRQAAGGRDRRQHPQAPQARPVQGQGREVPGRESSAARSERLVSSHAGTRTTAHMPHPGRTAPRISSPRRHLRVRKRSPVARHGRGWSSPARPRTLRPAHRRHRREHAGLRIDAGGSAARTATRRPRPSRSARCSPSGRCRPGSARRCSTAAATPTTAGSRRWPTAPAKPAGSDDHRLTYGDFGT